MRRSQVARTRVIAPTGAEIDKRLLTVWKIWASTMSYTQKATLDSTTMAQKNQVYTGTPAMA